MAPARGPPLFDINQTLAFGPADPEPVPEYEFDQLGRRRICNDLRDEGKICSVNRVGRRMGSAGLKDIPQRKRWRHKPNGKRPAPACDHLDRDFRASAPNGKWVTDITHIRTAEHWLYLCVVIDLYSRLVVGGSMSACRTASWCCRRC